MFKKSINGKTPGIITQAIAILLCLCILLSAGNSFFAVSAKESDTDTEGISDGFTELKEADDSMADVSKLSAATIALLKQEMTQLREEPVNEPPEQEPVSGDGTTIEKITVRWLSQSTGEIEPAGFGRLKLSPESNKFASAGQR